MASLASSRGAVAGATAAGGFAVTPRARGGLGFARAAVAPHRRVLVARRIDRDRGRSPRLTLARLASPGGVGAPARPRAGSTGRARAIAGSGWGRPRPSDGSPRDGSDGALVAPPARDAGPRAWTPPGSSSSSSRGALCPARGSLRPRGMTDEEWAKQCRETNPNYRTFTNRAKTRISEQGPRLGDMLDKNVVIPDPDEPGAGPPKALMNLEMIGRSPDRFEPDWKTIPRMTTAQFDRALDMNRVLTFQVWDAPERNEKFPPKFFQQPIRPRRYVVKLRDGQTKWVDTVADVFDEQWLARAHRENVWYTYHQKPDVNKMQSWQYLGSAVGGFAFLVGSIYLGIVRKHSIPQDAVQAMEFAQSRADARKDAHVEVTLEDVGGLENIVEDLNEVIAFLKNPEQFKRLGAKPPKGLLMEGGPGVGKTLIAKAIAGEAEVPFYSMSGAEFVEIIVGVGAARVRDLFKRARLNAPCLIFVDEIDALGTKRAAAGTRGTEEHEQTLNQLLTEMDGFTPDTGVVFVGATNRADLLDPALMRPGRFDRKVTVPSPGIEARAKILQIHLAKRNVDPEIDTLQFAKNLPGLSGAELANICNEAAAASVRRGGDRIETPDVYEAVDRVTNGLRHPIQDKDNDVVHRLTRHELGHAIVATVLHQANGLIEPVDRVSIIPRGRDPTQTTYDRKSDEEYMFPTRARLLERVQVLLAGRAAEEVCFGEDVTSYGSEDARDANDLTRNVVVNYALGQPDMVTTYTYDPDTLVTPERTIQTRKSRVASTGEMDRHAYNRKIHGFGRNADFDHYQYAERKILQIINEAMANNRAILEAYRDAMDVAFEELLAQDVITGERLRTIMNVECPPNPASAFNTKGPDTPCKPLKSEDEESAEGTRVIADRAEKARYAVEHYYPHATLDVADLRDRLDGKPYGKERSELELGDWMPQLKKAPHLRGREVPDEPWGVIAMRENLAEDPDWLRKEHVRFTRAADDERLAELRDVLIPELEAKRAAAKFEALPTEEEALGAEAKRDAPAGPAAESKAYERHGAHQRPGADGLTDAERRRLRAYEREVSAIEERWSGDGWEPDPNLCGIPPLWRSDLAKDEEEMKLRFKLGPVEGTMAYDMFQEVKRGFEAGGYVRTWDGKYYKREECVRTPRGEWCREKDLPREQRAFELDRGERYRWLTDIDLNGF